jgi:hypothetical protein
VGTIKFRSKKWMRRFRIGLRPVMSVGASILTMATGSVIVGLAVAGIATASIVVGGSVAGKMTEGRSVAGAGGGWGQAGASRELHGPNYVQQNSGESGAAGERWERRGEARICRSWCVVGGSECFDVCGAAPGE